MCLSGAGVDVFPAEGGGEVTGNLAAHWEPERAERWEDSSAVVVEGIARRAATLPVSSVSDCGVPSCLLAAG